MRRLNRIERLVVLIAGFVTLSVTTAQAQSNLPSIAQSSSTPPRANSADMVGSNACLGCHAQISSRHASHSLSTQDSHARGIACETCHGPGKKHLQSGGDQAQTLSFKDNGTEKEDSVCLGCHAASLPRFKHAMHREAGIGCVGCHSIHNSENKKYMLKQSETALCETCHADVKTAFELPSHHKVNEGAVACTDCHDPHSGEQKPGALSIALQNQTCIQCHNDTAGPYTNEHPPVSTEGCISCHAPHGSPNAHLLTKTNLNDLCTQCHTPIPNYTEPGTKPFHDQKTQSMACTSCHSHIHGSNASRYFFK